MFGSLIQRVIFWDLVKVFFISLTAITGLLLMAGLFSEATQRGLEPGQVLSIIPLLIPSTLPYTLPATTLFATCVVYGRLAADNEILAIKAAGINVLKVVAPAILLGLLVSGVTALLYYDTIPSTHYYLRARVIEDIEDHLYSMLRRHGSLRYPNLNYGINVKRVDGRRLIDAYFTRRDAKGNADVYVFAREAELRVHLAQKQVLVQMWNCYISGEKDGGYMAYKMWPVDLPPEILSAVKTGTGDMTWSELFERKSELQEMLRGFHDDIDVHQAAINQRTAPDNFPKHVEDRRNNIRHHEGLLRNVEAEMHMRPALALGCLCFVLVGCPVGIWFSRSDYLSAFITCFLPIVFIYYPLLLCGINVARSGHFHPAVALWAANGLLAVAAFGLFRKLLRN